MNRDSVKTALCLWKHKGIGFFVGLAARTYAAISALSRHLFLKKNNGSRSRRIGLLIGGEGGIPTIEASEASVQIREKFLEFFGFFKEDFGSNGKELGLVFCAIVVKNFAFGAFAIAEGEKVLAHDFGPRPIIAHGRQDRSAIKRAIGDIQDVGKLVGRGVLSIVFVS